MMTLFLTWFEIMAGEGAKWPEPTNRSYTQLAVIAVILVAVTLYVRYYYANRTRKLHEEQFFLFKARQKGLTEYQSKMVQGMAGITGLKYPDLLLNDETQFENSIARFLTYVSSRDESRDSLSSICHDIIITYEKIFHHTIYRKPLTKLYEVEINILICFFTDSDEAYIGKLRRINREYMVLKLFRSAGKFIKLAEQHVTVYLWRAGDAEYTFSSTVMKVEKDLVELVVPTEFTRGKEVRHPYINVFIPCEVNIDAPAEKNAEPAAAETTAEMGQNELIDKILAEEEAARHPGKEEVPPAAKEPDFTGDIVKINEHEAVVRFEKKIDYRKLYILDFDIDEFHYKIKASPVSDRIIEREHVYNYTFRFNDISENALRVLRNFIAENSH